MVKSFVIKNMELRNMLKEGAQRSIQIFHTFRGKSHKDQSRSTLESRDPSSDFIVN